MSNVAPAFIPGTPFDPSVSTYTRFAGRDLEPHEFSGWRSETSSWKRSCYIGNWSTLRKSLLTGPDAITLFSRVGINGFDTFNVGQAKHIVMCTEPGHVAGEGVLLRLDADRFLLTSGPAVTWLHHVIDQGGFDVEAREVTKDWFILQVQGPSSIHVLEKLAGERIRDIGFMRFRELKAGALPFYALRQGMSGELGYELHGDAASAEPLYRMILDAGREYDIRQLGGRSKMVNHAEACFPTPSVDYLPAYMADPSFVAIHGPARPPHVAGSLECCDLSEMFRTPIQLGWGKSIRWNHDFIGKDALRAEWENPRSTIVTLLWDAADIAAIQASYFDKEAEPYDYLEFPRNLLGCLYQDRVEKDGQLVGVSTSRTYSIHFREMISLCVIDSALAAPGSRVEVIWGAPQGRQKRVKATVATAPYKADRRRVDLADYPAMPLT